MDKAEQIYKKYKSQVQSVTLTAFFLYLILSAILDFAGLFPLVIPAAVIVTVISRKRVLSLARKHIMGVILDDLDAPLYREVITKSGIGAKNVLHLMESEFYVGNIRGAIALGEAVYANASLSAKLRYSALAFLAQYYYCLGDDEELASACRRFRECSLPKRGAHIRKTEKVIEKFEYFLAGDYDSFIRPINPKLKGTIYPIVQSFNEARVALKKGDTETAKTVFSALSAAADNTVFGMIARRAVEAIDVGKEYREAVARIECEPLDAGATVAKYITESRKSNRVRRILYIVIAVILIIYLPQSIRSWLREVDERITLGLLDDSYDSVEILDTFSFKINGVQTEKTFVADVGDGLIVGGRYRGDEDEWVTETYAYVPYSELEASGSKIFSFLPHGSSKFLYITVNDYYSTFPDDEFLLCKTYYINDGFVTVIVDDTVPG